MNKLVKGLAVAGLATGIVSGSLATGTGLVVGYFAKKDLDALAKEYSQTQEFIDLKKAEEQRLEERFLVLEDARQDFEDGKLSSEQMQSLEDEFNEEVTYLENEYIYDCMASSSDKYFQEKLEQCKKTEKVGDGFFYTGVAVYGLKGIFFLGSLEEKVRRHNPNDDSPICSTSYLREAIDYVMQQ